MARNSEPPGAVPAAAATTARSTHIRNGATAVDEHAAATAAAVTSWRMGMAAISAGVRRSNDPPIPPRRGLIDSLLGRRTARRKTAGRARVAPRAGTPGGPPRRSSLASSASANRAADLARAFAGTVHAPKAHGCLRLPGWQVDFDVRGFFLLR